MIPGQPGLTAWERRKECGFLRVFRLERCCELASLEASKQVVKRLKKMYGNLD